MDNHAGGNASSQQCSARDVPGLKSPLCTRVVHEMVDPTLSAGCPFSWPLLGPSSCPEPCGWVSLLPVEGSHSAASCQGPAGALIAHSAATMVHVAPEWNKWCLSKCKLQPAPVASSALNGSNQRPPNYSRLQKSDSPPKAFKGEGKRRKAVTLAGGLGRPGGAIGASLKGSALISFHLFPFVFHVK